MADTATIETASPGRRRPVDRSAAARDRPNVGVRAGADRSVADSGDPYRLAHTGSDSALLAWLYLANTPDGHAATGFRAQFGVRLVPPRDAESTVT